MPHMRRWIGAGAIAALFAACTGEVGDGGSSGAANAGNAGDASAGMAGSGGQTSGGGSSGASGGQSGAAGASGSSGSGGAGASGTGGSAGSAVDAGPDASAPILSVDFDQTPLGTYTQESFNSDWPGGAWGTGLGSGRGQIVEGAEAYSGRSLRVRYPSGTFGPQSQAVQFHVKLPKSFDQLYVAYRVKFGAGFNFVKGGKIPGLCGGGCNTGGNKPTGSDGWSARMMWRTSGGAVQYVYHADQPTIYGEDFAWMLGTSPVKFAPGTWHQVEHRIVINTPGVKDGVIQGWFDGVLALDRKDVRFRTVSSFSIDAFRFETFFGGGDSSWAATKDEFAYFDDFVVAEGPITH
jgi:hypothetical protein